MNKRLKTFLNSKGLSISEFERTCGFSNGTISKFIRGETKILYDKFVIVSKKFPELDLNWLFTGNGNMIYRPESELAIENEKLKENIKILEDTIKSNIESQKMINKLLDKLENKE